MVLSLLLCLSGKTYVLMELFECFGIIQLFSMQNIPKNLHFLPLAGNYSKHFLGLVNGKNTQSQTDFFESQCSKQFFKLANKRRFKVLNVVIQFSSILSLFRVFLHIKSCFQRSCWSKTPKFLVKLKVVKTIPVSIHTRTCVSEGKKCQYFENFQTPIKWIITDVSS